MRHKLGLLYSWFIRTLLVILPDQPLVMRLRGFLYSVFMSDCGKDFQVSSTVIIRNLENLKVGNNVYLAPNVIINAIDTITLESQVMIGFNSVLVSGNHTLFNGSYRYGLSFKAPILIKYGSWIGANSTVVAGATLGQGSLLAANSVIINDCSISGIYGGVPAKKLR